MSAPPWSGLDLVVDDDLAAGPLGIFVSEVRCLPIGRESLDEIMSARPRERRKGV